MAARRAAVIGHPVAHSRSPRMHNAGFAALGLNWRYDALDVVPEALGAFLAGLPRSGLAGVNVTIPHKRSALEACDELSVEARRAGGERGATALVGSAGDGIGRVPGRLPRRRDHGASADRPLGRCPPNRDMRSRRAHTFRP